MQGNLNILRNKQFQKPSRVLVVKFLQIYFYLAKSKRNHILFYFTPKLHYWNYFDSTVITTWHFLSRSFTILRSLHHATVFGTKLKCQNSLCLFQAFLESFWYLVTNCTVYKGIIILGDDLKNRLGNYFNVH